MTPPRFDRERYNLKYAALEKSLREYFGRGMVKGWKNELKFSEYAGAADRLEQIATRHGYKLLQGTPGTPVEPVEPLKIIVPDLPEAQDTRIADLLEGIMQAYHLQPGDVVLADGAQGKVITMAHRDAAIATLVLEDAGITKRVRAADFLRYSLPALHQQRVVIAYDDDETLLTMMLAASERTSVDLVYALEARNKHFSNEIRGRRGKTVVQKLGLIEILEGTVQSELEAKGLPHAILMPAAPNPPHSLDHESLFRYIQKSVLKTASRIRATDER